MDAADGFDEFYARARPRLVRALMLTTAGDVEAAAEAVDEALVRTLERWAKVRDMASPEAWAFTVARNNARRRFRRRRTEDRLLASQRRPEAADDTAAAADRVALWEAVGQLSERDREALAHRYLLGLTEADVAVVMGTSTGTASAALARARLQLRVALGDEDRR